MFPLLLDVQGSHCFKEPRGTSRGNSLNIHFGIQASGTLINKGVASSDIVILTPYLCQCRLWKEALRKYPKFAGVRVVTAESMQGSEARIVFWGSSLRPLSKRGDVGLGLEVYYGGHLAVTSFTSAVTEQEVLTDMLEFRLRLPL